MSSPATDEIDGEQKIDNNDESPIDPCEPELPPVMDTEYPPDKAGTCEDNPDSQQDRAYQKEWKMTPIPEPPPHPAPIIGYVGPNGEMRLRAAVFPSRRYATRPPYKEGRKKGNRFNKAW
eukprot:GHVO01022095.1.p2 GENE.GHVO01022095.1~~GHVO01022095.1.p2  ORF type:complete len:120 (-),score=23.80 GHVO01022095.1:38-397(-)